MSKLHKPLAVLLAGLFVLNTLKVMLGLELDWRLTVICILYATWGALLYRSTE